MTIDEIASTVNRALGSAGYGAVTMAIEDGPVQGCDVFVKRTPDSIALCVYPSLLKKTSFEAVKACLVELGRNLLSTATKTQKVLWEKRMVYALPLEVNEFQERLSSGRFESFQAIVRSIPRAVIRLVAIHLANGLLANGQKIKSAANIKVDQWGTTSEFATGKKPYSLIPLVSSYAPAGIFHDFGEAFADHVLNQMGSIGESSVRQAYSRLVSIVVGGQLKLKA